MNYIIILTALLPIAILAFYIWRKDYRAPEPAGLLIKAFFFGALSPILSFCFSIPFQYVGLYSLEPTSITESLCTAFLGAAIPEELAKLIMLWLLLRKNHYFDEKMDGILYAVCVSLGFAAVENLLYLFSNSESFLSVGLCRAFFAVPGHFCFGILMGYYYSLAKFYPKALMKNIFLVLLAPIIAHGVYDSILFVISVEPGLSGILLIVFLLFCNKMWKYASKSIEQHLKRDENLPDIGNI